MHRKTKSRAKTRKPRQPRDARSCVAGGMAVRLPPQAVVGPTVSPWWVLSLLVHFFNAAFCALLVLRFGPRVLPMLGHFEPPLQVSLIHMTLNFILSPITWPNSLKSAIKTQTSQNKRNCRNRGVNHINIHLNPLKWILNTQLILCKYDTYHTYKHMHIHTYIHTYI